MWGVKFKKLNPLAGIGTQELVGIDFSSNNLKIAQLRAAPHKSELIGLFHQPTSGLSDDDLSKIIGISVNELKAKKPRIVNIIPSHLVITKNIEIPSTDPQEIREIIDLQAGRHTPYSREEIIVDYIGIGTYKHSYTKILLVIAPRQVINRQYDILAKAGLELERVIFAPEGIAATAAQLLQFQTQGSPINILHIDEGSTDFIIVFNEKVIFLRSISIGSSHLVNEREKYQIRFTEEIRRSLEAYQGEDVEKNPALMILVGAVQELKDLEVVLNDALRLPVRVITQFKNLTISDMAFKTISISKNLSFFGLISSLIAWEKTKVNLIPGEIKLRKLVEERGKDLIKTGILVLTVFLLFFSILVSKIYFRSAYLKKLDTKYQSLSSEARELENDFERISLIKGYNSSRGFSLEVLTELYNIAPLDLELNDIRLDDKGRFTIKGTAESMSIVFSFVENLTKSKYFNDVKTKYTTARKEGTKDVTDFEIASMVNKEAR